MICPICLRTFEHDADHARIPYENHHPQGIKREVCDICTEDGSYLLFVFSAYLGMAIPS